MPNYLDQIDRANNGDNGSAWEPHSWMGDIYVPVISQEQARELSGGARINGGELLHLRNGNVVGINGAMSSHSGSANIGTTEIIGYHQTIGGRLVSWDTDNIISEQVGGTSPTPAFWDGFTPQQRVEAEFTARARNEEYTRRNTMTLSDEAREKLGAIAIIPAVGNAAMQGAYAGVDGLIPGSDPFATAGAYDPTDRALQASQAVGRLTFEVETSIATGGVLKAFARGVAGPAIWGAATPIQQAGLRYAIPLTLVHQAAGTPGATAVVAGGGYLAWQKANRVWSDSVLIWDVVTDKPPKSPPGPGGG